MPCDICGAPASNTQANCSICGGALKPDTPRRWDRTVEAMAFEDLHATLREDEALLGITRGRIAGSWRRKVSLNPQALLSPFANLGLTGERLILQSVHPSTGRAVSDRASEFPLGEVVSLTVSDADPLEPGRTVRLEGQTCHGDSFRLRAGGRLADSAREMVEVWRSLSEDAQTLLRPAEPLCPHCARTLDRPHRFCPFCGREL